MRLVRRLFIALLTAAMVAGPLPTALALGCIPHVEHVAGARDDNGCDRPQAEGIDYVCIHYPAPHLPGSLAVLGVAPPLLEPVTLIAMPPAPPVAVPAREEPPDTPPPRVDHRRHA